MTRQYSDGDGSAHAWSTLASGASITDTSIDVATGEGARLPAAGPFTLTIANGTDPFDPAYLFEIVEAGTPTGDTIPTSALTMAWSAGAYVLHTIAKPDLDEFAQQTDVDAALAGKQALSEKGAASGYASLSAGTKVVEDPANATATPTASKIPIADGSGKLDGWISAPVLASLIDAAGDLLVGTADNTAGRLAKGSALQTLRVNAGATALEWATPSSGGATLKAKSADESVTSSTTLQDDDHLTFAVEASGIYLVEYFLKVLSASATPDLKLAFTAPSGATFDWGPDINSANEDIWVPVGTGDTPVAASNLSTEANFGLSANNTKLIHVKGILIVDTTAGNFTLRWAQSSSNGNATTIKKGSMVRYQKAT